MQTLFLRDDDVGALTPELRRFAAIFEQAGLPVSYQIIPAKLTDECAAFLRDRKAAAPDLYEFGQHGLTHQVRVGARVFNHEFGAETGYADQARIIGEGRAILDARLGDAWDGALFTPPQHKFDRNTLKALAANGFLILSASSYTGRKHRLIYAIGRLLGLTSIRNGGVSRHGRQRPEAPLAEVSIAVAVDEGSPVERTVDQIVAGIAQARRFTPHIGLMFHHGAWSGEAKWVFLGELAARLRDLPETRFSTIAPIARGVV